MSFLYSKSLFSKYDKNSDKTHVGLTMRNTRKGTIHDS